MRAQWRSGPSSGTFIARTRAPTCRSWMPFWRVSTRVWMPDRALRSPISGTPGTASRGWLTRGRRSRPPADIVEHAERWAVRLEAAGELASKLVQFCKLKIE